MNPTPYQLATLAARIAPQLCADRSKQKSAVYLALRLIAVSTEVLAEEAAEINENKENQEAFEHEREFRKHYNLKGAHIDYRRAAAVITGHAEDRHVSRAVSKFEKLIMDYEDPWSSGAAGLSEAGVTRLSQGQRRSIELLEAYRASGVPVGDVVAWRKRAEQLGVCAKNFLTGELRELPPNLRKVPENSAAGVPKVIGKRRKRAEMQQ